MTDRQAMNPNRIKFTDEDSGVEYIGTWEYADNPVVDGTLMNKAAFLKDATASALGLSGADPTVDDALALLAAHKSRHAMGGADALAPSDIGAASLDSNSKVAASQANSRIVSVTANKTLAMNDNGTFQRVGSSSAITVTIPPNSSVAFPVGTEIEFVRWETGTVTFAEGSGVTLNSVDDKRTIRAQYCCAGIKKLDTDTWLLVGDLA